MKLAFWAAVGFVLVAAPTYAAAEYLGAIWAAVTGGGLTVMAFVVVAGLGADE